VRWDLSHDQQGEGLHHGDIVTFLRGHGVRADVTGHIGPPMANTLQRLGVIPLVNASGDARARGQLTARPCRPPRRENGSLPVVRTVGGFKGTVLAG